MGFRHAVVAIVAPIAAGCANTPSPRLSSFEDAPAIVRERAEIDYSDPRKPVERYRVVLSHPDGPWLDLGARFVENEIFVPASVAVDDSLQADPIGLVKIDTGANLILDMSIEHPLADRLWKSAGYGQRRGSSIRGHHSVWRGVATSIDVAGVTLRPAPISLSEPDRTDPDKVPLLGQEWVGVLQGAWIDPATSTFAVSFDRIAVDAFVHEHEGRWVVLPWLPAKPRGLRFVPVRIAGRDFAAVIDTGAEGELFLDGVHPPQFVREPWSEASMIGSQGPAGRFFESTSKLPLILDTFEVPNPVVAWFGVPSTTLPLTPEGRSFAILGMDFLRRYPALLDPVNDRACFFIGSRSDLHPPLPVPVTPPGPEPKAD